MIEKFFTQPKTLSRLHAGLLGLHLSAVAEVLEQAQYSTASIRLHFAGCRPLRGLASREAHCTRRCQRGYR